MVYKTIRPIIRFALKQFFSEIKIRGADKCESGPVLFVANHPNFALDALVVASCFKRNLWFLAKASLFKNPLLKWFFESCHMIPVARRMDSADGTVDNTETFRLAVDSLCKGRAIVIFPEGISLGERRLSPLKTGAARIVFQAEELRKFNLGTVIQPIGLNYTDLRKFKSSVTVTFAEPIKITDFAAHYERDAIEAVKTLTDKIEEGMRSVSVEIADSNLVELVEKITSVYRTRSIDVDDHNLMKTVATNVEKLRAKDPKVGQEVEGRIDDYLDLASVFAVDGSISLDTPFNKFRTLALMPFVLLGIIINILPYRLIGRIVGGLANQPVFVASYKFGLGALIFLVWYLMIAFLVAFLTNSCIWFVLTFILVAFSGYLVNRHLNSTKLFLLSSLWPGKKKPVEVLKLLRNQLIQELESLRVA